MLTFQNISGELAQELDAEDPLASMRDQFIAPGKEGKRDIYFLGNSLGLQPKRTKEYISQVLDDWGSLGVESFFHARQPWMDYHQQLTKPLSIIVGAKESEVAVMNQLTVNLHLLLSTFYRPSGKRIKILCEAKAFPSDQYAFETHVALRGFSAKEAVLEVAPRQGELLLRTEDILQTMHEHKDEIALVLLGGINYYTGQVLDMRSITHEAGTLGIPVGFDLAHAAGNIRLELHNWGVDFACWCNYKYLNAGPGAIGAIFIHERHHNQNLPRLAGWWGYDQATRFNMEPGFKPMEGAAGWQLSTPSIILYASLKASLDLFMEAGWDQVQKKRKLQNDFLWAVLKQKVKKQDSLQIITPADPIWRGSQVSFLVEKNGRNLFDQLTTSGIITDWREPNVIRLAPVPLYNSFAEIFELGEQLERHL